MIHLSACPICESEKISLQLNARDNSVTKEDFEIYRCENCGFLFTQDIPEEENTAKYYQSETYISHSDTSKGFINRIYHSVRRYTLGQKRKLIERISGRKQGNILDIGSGTGSFLHTMKQSGWTVTGIEPDPIARENSQSINGIAAVAPEAQQSFAAESFDVITMWHVLEHVHKLDEQMKQLKRLLTPNGKLFIAVPNHTSYDAVHYKEFWAAWDVPRHLYHFAPATMQVLADKYGFEIVQHRPMWFDSLYVSMLSEKYKTGKSNLLKAIFTGVVSNWKALMNVKKCSSVIYVMQKRNLIP